MGEIIAVCISEKKGTVKTSVNSAHFIEDFGIEGDAHAGKWHRQISLLSFESFEKFKDTVKIDIKYGAFGENLLVKGLDVSKIEIGTEIISNDVKMQVTQIGKVCHKDCEIRRLVGNCIMPTEGIFLKVLSSGTIKPGDGICIEHI